MKKLLFICALFMGAIPMLNAQEASTTTEPTPEQYETMIENYYNVKFREMAFESLELTEDEITKFDPLYAEYISRKKDIVQRRNKLVEKYRDEMMEDDDAEEKADERADFIENYWETQIKEMELKKDFFDRFEDIVSNEKAINFFLLEEKMQSRVEEASLIQIVPMMIEVREYYPTKKHKDTSMNWDEKKDMSTDKTTTTTTDKKEWSSDDKKMTDKKEWNNKSTATTTTTGMDKSMTDKKDTSKDWTSKGTATYTTNTSNISALAAYNKWIEKADNKVALNHQYTHNGLQKLVSAIWAVAGAHDIDASAWSDKKEKIMSVTTELQKDPMSTDHADITREAFEMTAVMINAIQDKKGTDKTKDVATKVTSAANAINPDRLMTDQATEIYNFFGQANKALHALADVDAWGRSSASTQNK
ncbi:hypothetical protein [Flavilitoribacter nigricans]|uniref:DUF5667 domain-containing protein n=1 Tax=Flavilitoribacter nigricans (strain ATCC 23147 / DSM 23189 / NBRC 102662 / NCIMB 1420 / SS-2) TaxID=1122177 RepID=A0A2D0N8F1_FLAN2|nr:hypothetical protein [Flavilitoribacter nigricans]PHN04792.1 hypothetical protein CRP01_19975 [Flavilitoribacter nigricans DSM 23189 = NBRC 102662]